MPSRHIYVTFMLSRHHSKIESATKIWLILLTKEVRRRAQIEKKYLEHAELYYGEQANLITQNDFPLAPPFSRF